MKAIIFIGIVCIILQDVLIDAKSIVDTDGSLGNSTVFENSTISGNATLSDVASTVSGNTTLLGNSTISGNDTVSDVVSTISGNTTLLGNSTISGNATVSDAPSTISGNTMLLGNSTISSNSTYFGYSTFFGNSNLLHEKDPVPFKRTNCECGYSMNRLSTRIVGGERSSILQYPWMAGVSAFGFIYCGGALINDRYVITAAHCFKEPELEHHAEVLLGITNRNDNAVRYQVSEIILHENYNRTIKGHFDIALLKLAKPVTFTDKIRPICLPLPGANYTNMYAMAAGWGVVEHGGDISDELHAVSMKVLDFDLCKSILHRIDGNNLCAGGEEGKDACQGDSGSPLFVNQDGINRIIGIVSWGVGCAKQGLPGVFTNVMYYEPWVLNHTQDAQCYDTR